MIVLIIAAGGAFKQILIDSGMGETVKDLTGNLNLSPLFLAWLITASLRVTLGSATVAALTASGMVLPLIGPLLFRGFDSEGKIAQIRAPILFLLSNKSSFITEADLRINKRYTA